MSLAGPITGRRVLLAFIAFFGVIFIANAIFLWLATDTFTGLSTENAYRKGIAYNDRLDRADAQRRLDWRAATAFQSTGAGTGQFSLALETADGSPVVGRTVTAVFRRPVVEGIDFSTVLSMAEDGRYLADIAPPEPGQWDVRLEVSRPGSLPYLIETRIWSK